jgi:hypothetical protein
MHTTPHAALAKLLDEFATLILAVLIRRDWHNVPALYSAISGAFAAIDDFRSECRSAGDLAGSIYSSPALPLDARCQEFTSRLEHYSKVFQQEAAAICSLAARSVNRTVQPFRTDAELIAYLRRMESEARLGIELLRKAALIVDAQATGKKGVFVDIKV